MSHTYKSQLADLLQSAQANLRENRAEFARADFLQAVKLAEKHFGPHSTEVDEALRPSMELHFQSDEIDAGFACFDKIDRNYELRKNQTHERVYFYNDVAVIFGNKRKNDEAYKLLNRALTLSEKIDKVHVKVRVHTLINLGYYHFRDDRYAECIRFLQEGLRESKAVTPYPAAEYAKAAIILARALFETKADASVIIPLLEHALPVISSLSQTPTENTGIGYNTLGIIFYRAGRYHDARYAFDKASSALEFCQPSSKFYLSHNHVWSSDNEIKLGNLQRAESLVRKALEISVDAHPEHDPAIVNAKLAVTDFLIPRGQYVESATLLEEVIASIEARNGRDDPNLQRHCNNLGYVYVHLERFPLAEGILRRAQKFTLQKTPAQPCPFITKNLGLMYQKMGYDEKAVVEYKKARKLFITLHGNEHPMVSFIDNALMECGENS
jgi:tetratricopeptide (TPR) repeat protein